jgi:hypothetical protein
MRKSIICGVVHASKKENFKVGDLVEVCYMEHAWQPGQITRRFTTGELAYEIKITDGFAAGIKVIRTPETTYPGVGTYANIKRRK